jgi:predicted kinase
MMMIGIPGSGKSTIAQQIGNILSVPVLSSDSFRAALSPHVGESDQTVSTDAWKQLFLTAQDSIENNTSIIIDATHSVERFRRRDVQTYHQFGAKAVIGLYVRSDASTAIQRNSSRHRIVPEDVILKMYDNLLRNPPSVDDGFDYVVNIDNH